MLFKNYSDNHLINFVKTCYSLAEQKKSKLDNLDFIKIEGQSGTKNLNLLNNLCSIPNTNYLEIGLFNGLTFCSALYGNKIEAVGIDNWSEFGGSVEKFDINLHPYIGNNKVVAINGDCFSDETYDKIKSIINVIGKFDVYYYDGPHSQENHYDAIIKYSEYLSERFVLVVDDWQQLEVQKGTLYALRDKGYKIMWENHCRSVNDDAHNWWCGAYLALLRK